MDHINCCLVDLLLGEFCISFLLQLNTSSSLPLQ
jgi:hypothetical protein